MGTGQVQHRVDTLAGLADEGRVGQVADQGGFIGGQLADRPAVQQAQAEALAQVRPQGGSDDSGGAGD
ncbi:hypothetical protein D3C81_2272290 [compost metagenome]